MSSPHLKQVSTACLHGCFSAPFTEYIIPRPKHGTTSTTGRSSSSAFIAATTSLFTDVHFNNHESLPPLPIAFFNFTATYPKYADTVEADHVRGDEYSHLSNHICLDYSGLSLFSHAKLNSSTASSSATSPSSSHFSIVYKSVSLRDQLRYGTQETALESVFHRRIMSFLDISEDDYSMVCTANRTSAFKLLAESFPFHSNKRLLTVYDHESEAVNAMTESAQKRGAKVMCAEFSWPSLRIHSEKLKKMVSTTKKKKKNTGLFVFPPESQATGAKYPYQWMSSAQENGWTVVLDACALGAKDMGTLGLSLIQPDFIVCSFFKVFGENPSGFAGLLIKRSSRAILETSTVASTNGIVSIVPESRHSQLPDDNILDTNLEIQPSNPNISDRISNRLKEDTSSCRGETTDANARKINRSEEIEFRGLDHADSLGLRLISKRLCYLINWLVNALMKLQHPCSENGFPLVRIYGPRLKLYRGPVVAFNIFDGKGEIIKPDLVQKLADRSNISLNCQFLSNIWFSDKYQTEKGRVLEGKIRERTIDGKKKQKTDMGINVVTASLGFLNNFEDVYRLWYFVARFLDADFVEKERWIFTALNQETIEM